MPAVNESVTVTETKIVMVAKDKDGADLRIGDKVSLTLEIAGIQEVPSDPARQIPSKDQLSLIYVLPNGHRLHMGIHDADMFKKV